MTIAFTNLFRSLASLTTALALVATTLVGFPLSAEAATTVYYNGAQLIDNSSQVSVNANENISFELFSNHGTPDFTNSGDDFVGTTWTASTITASSTPGWYVMSWTPAPSDVGLHGIDFWDSGSGVSPYIRITVDAAVAPSEPADTQAPSVAHVNTSVNSPERSATITFTSSEDGDVTYGGDCSAGTLTEIVASTETATTFSGLSVGDYNCDIFVTDASGNKSGALGVSFTVEATTHAVAEGQSVADAIAGAQEGDVIALGAGTHSGFTVNEAVTVTTEESAIVDGHITVAHDGVTISGLTIENPNGSYGIVINNVSNVTVTGNTIAHIGSELSFGSAQAIYLQGGAGSSIANITISNNEITDVGNENLAYSPSVSGTSAKGIYVGDSTSSGTITNLVVEGNTITDIKASSAAWNIGRGAIGIMVNFGGSTTATIENNVISDLAGLWARGIGLEANTPNTVLDSNTITGLVDSKGGLDMHAILFQSNPGMTSVELDGEVLGNLGMVGVNPDWTGYTNNPVVTLSGENYLYGVNAFTTPAAGISAADSGAEVTLAAGTYTTPVSITKPMTLEGAGDDATSGTILEIAGGTGITVAADDITIRNLRVSQNGTGSGIAASGVEINDLTLDGVTVTGANSGFRVGSGTTVDGFTVTDSHFDGNTFGWYLAKESAASATSNVTDVTVTDTSFSNNLQKGIYAEKLDNAVFDGITVDASGIDANYAYNAGIDINLKWSAYEDIAIKNSTITGSGLMGSSLNPLFPVGITIKARSDGGYATPAATLDGVELLNLVVEGGVNGIRFGEPGKGNVGPTNVVVEASSITGASHTLLANETTTSVMAEGNWWGATTGPADGMVTGLVDYTPWLGDEDGDTVATETETETSESVVASDGSTVTVTIPDGTLITGDDSWDGTVDAAVAVDVTTLDDMDASGQTAFAPVAAISLGSDDNSLTLSSAAQLVFAGHAGKRVGWTTESDGSSFTEITRTCTANDQATVDAQLGEGEDCKINSGSDLVVWTKHFTTFVAYTSSEVAGSSGGGGGGGSSRSGSGGGSSGDGTSGNNGAVGEVLGAAVYNFTRELTLGMTGEDVMALQNLLVAEGFFRAKIATTNYFGPITLAAVKEYQASRGIPATGYVGPLTLQALNAGTAPGLSAEQRAAIMVQIEALMAQVAAMQLQLEAMNEAN